MGKRGYILRVYARVLIAVKMLAFSALPWKVRSILEIKVHSLKAYSFF